MAELRALTINIWNQQGPWEARKAILRDDIEALDADIVALQEVVRRGDRSQADELAEGFGYHVAFGSARAIDDRADYGNALLSRFPILKTQVIALPCLGVDEPRSVLLTELGTNAGRLPVLVSHFSYRMDHGFVRERQALAVADMLEKSVPTGEDVLPAVFMGDLNASPDASEIRFLLGLQVIDGRSICLADCYGETGEPPGYTFDGRHNAFAAPWHERPRRIDYILVHGPDPQGRGKPLAAQVVMTGDPPPRGGTSGKQSGIFASDHFGVFARIRM